MQDGIVELIQRTLSYEYKKYHKFSGYIKAYMEYYFRRLYFKQNFEQNISCDELYDSDISQNDIYDYEITSMVDNLEEKQCYIIRENVLKNKKLKKSTKRCLQNSKLNEVFTLQIFANIKTNIPFYFPHHFRCTLILQV